MKIDLTNGQPGIFNNAIGHAYIDEVSGDVTITDNNPGIFEQEIAHGHIAAEGPDIFQGLFKSIGAIGILFYLLAIPGSWDMLIKSFMDGEDILEGVLWLITAVIAFVVCYLTCNPMFGKIICPVGGMLATVITSGFDLGIKSTFWRICTVPFMIALFVGFSIIPSYLAVLIRRLQLKNQRKKKQQNEERSV